MEQESLALASIWRKMIHRKQHCEHGIINLLAVTCHAISASAKLLVLGPFSLIIMFVI